MENKQAVKETLADKIKAWEVKREVLIAKINARPGTLPQCGGLADIGWRKNALSTIKANSGEANDLAMRCPIVAINEKREAERKAAIDPLNSAVANAKRAIGENALKGCFKGEAPTARAYLFDQSQIAIAGLIKGVAGSADKADDKAQWAKVLAPVLTAKGDKGTKGAADFAQAIGKAAVAHVLYTDSAEYRKTHEGKTRKASPKGKAATVTRKPSQPVIQG